jgi:hypothetical protein
VVIDELIQKDAPSIDLIRIRSGAGLLAKPWIIARESEFSGFQGSAKAARAVFLSAMACAQAKPEAQAHWKL